MSQNTCYKYIVCQHHDNIIKQIYISTFSHWPLFILHCHCSIMWVRAVPEKKRTGRGQLWWSPRGNQKTPKLPCRIIVCNNTQCMVSDGKVRQCLVSEKIPFVGLSKFKGPVIIYDGGGQSQMTFYGKYFWDRSLITTWEVVKFYPSAEWAAKIFSMKSHVTPTQWALTLQLSQCTCDIAYNLKRGRGTFFSEM